MLLWKKIRASVLLNKEYSYYTQRSDMFTQITNTHTIYVKMLIYEMRIETKTSQRKWHIQATSSLIPETGNYVQLYPLLFFVLISFFGFALSSIHTQAQCYGWIFFHFEFHSSCWISFGCAYRHENMLCVIWLSSLLTIIPSIRTSHTRGKRKT